MAAPPAAAAAECSICVLLQRAVDDKFRCLEEKEEKQQQLHLLLRDKERDLERQRCVLANNQETITVGGATTQLVSQLTSHTAYLCVFVCVSEPGAAAARQVPGAAAGARGHPEAAAAAAGRETEQFQQGESGSHWPAAGGAAGLHTGNSGDVDNSSPPGGAVHLSSSLHRCALSVPGLQELRSALLATIQSAPGDVLEELKSRLQLKDRLFQQVLSDRTRQAEEHQEQVEELLRTISSRDQYIQVDLLVPRKVLHQVLRNTLRLASRNI